MKVNDVISAIPNKIQFDVVASREQPDQSIVLVGERLRGSQTVRVAIDRECTSLAVDVIHHSERGQSTNRLYTTITNLTVDQIVDRVSGVLNSVEG